MNLIKAALFPFLFQIIHNNLIVLGKDDILSEEENPFWEVFHLLQTKNDLDIQSMIMISKEDDCQCHTSFCHSIIQEILEKNHLIPYTCISRLMIDSSNNNSSMLKKEEPALIILLSIESITQG